MQLPTHIWQLEGVEPGPNVTILGGTHGDELTGIELVRRILTGLDLLQQPAGCYRVPDVRGNLFVGFGNPEAMLRNTRGASATRDLNRSFSRAELDQPPTTGDRMDLRRARELVPLFHETDYLFDIHATSSPSEPFVCFGEDSLAHRRFYRLIPVRYILTDPHGVLPQDVGGGTELGTTDSYVNGRGKVALCYETGQATDFARVDLAMQVVARLLLEAESVRETFLARLGVEPADPSATPQERFALSRCIPATHAPFTYDPGMDQTWQHVTRGTRLGCYGTGEEVLVPEDGMLLFQKAPARVRVGENLYYLARRLEEHQTR